MREKRPPQQTPGAAHTEGAANDDFTLPAALYWDAVYFLDQARHQGPQTYIEAKERYLRAALLTVFAGFEATLNQATFAHAMAHADKIGLVERDILEERETILDERGYIVRRGKFYPLEARLSFIALFLSGKDFDRNSALWGRFRRAKELRDTWTHPKPPFDTWSLTVEDVEEAITTIKEMLGELSRLMGLEPPLWLTPASEVLAGLKTQQAKSAPDGDVDE